MVVVVALLALAPDPGDELLAREGRPCPSVVTASPPFRRAATSQPAAATACRFGRVLAEHRVGVVDVDVDPPRRRAGGRGAPGSRARRPRAGGPSPRRACVPRPSAGSSSARPERSRRRTHQSCALERVQHRRRDCAHRGEVRETPPGGGLADAQADVVVVVGRRQPFQVNRTACRARPRARRTAPIRRPSAPASSPSLTGLERAPRHLLGKALERSIEDIALGESAAHGLGGVDDERVRFPQGEQAQGSGRDRRW